MKKPTPKPDAPRFDAEGYQIGMHDLNGGALPQPGKVEFKPFTHGGARPGAGRKKSGRIPVVLRLSAATLALLRAKALAEHKRLSDVAEERLAGV